MGKGSTKEFFEIIHDFFNRTNYDWDHEDWQELLSEMKKNGHNVNSKMFGSFIEKERERYFLNMQKEGFDEKKDLDEQKLKELDMKLQQKEKALIKRELEILHKEKRLKDPKYIKNTKNVNEIAKIADQFILEKKKELDEINKSIHEQTVAIEKKEIELMAFERHLERKLSRILEKEELLIKEKKDFDLRREDILRREKAYDALIDNLRQRLTDLEIRDKRMDEMEKTLLYKMDNIERKTVISKK